MTRLWRALAALLLAGPLHAQAWRAPQAVPVSILAAPAAPGVSASAAALPALSAPAPAASLALPAALTPAPVAFVAPAAAPVGPAVPGSAAASDAESDSLFDGTHRLVSDSGAVFVPAAFRHPILGFEGPSYRRKIGPPVAARAVAGTEGLSGKALLAKIGEIAAAGHAGKDYGAAANYLFATADHVTLGGVSGVVDAYSGVFIPGTSSEGSDYGEGTDRNGDGWIDRGMNVEHVWPQSLFGHGLPMRSDLHHLMATFEHPNGMRGALPFGVVTGAPDYRNGAGAKRGGGLFEPPNATKGRVARALLYFYARYRGEAFFGTRSSDFWNRQIATVLDWNRRYPPDAEETRRNDLVESFQHNRNPFVDDPGLADRVGAEALRAGPSPGAQAAARVQQRRRSDQKRDKNQGAFRRGGSGNFGRR